MIGRGLTPIVLPRHAYEGMLKTLRECEQAMLSLEAKQKIRAAIAFAEQLKHEGGPLVEVALREEQREESMREAPPWIENR